jgi:hypothetical protein
MPGTLASESAEARRSDAGVPCFQLRADARANATRSLRYSEYLEMGLQLFHRFSAIEC